MKFAACFLAMLKAASASPLILSDPIPVYGSGSFEWSYPGDAYYRLYVQGTDGVNSVGFSQMKETGIAAGIRQSTDWLSDATYNPSYGACCYGWAHINDVISQRASFSIGRDAGYLMLYDAQGDLLASANLMSLLRVVNYAEETHFRSGDLAITAHAPEPSSVVLLVIGLVFIGTRAVPLLFLGLGNRRVRYTYCLPLIATLFQD